jgi:acetyl-CoA C-acetyltransferase
MKLARKVAVVGSGMTRFHHRIHADKTSREIFTEAALEAMASVDKGIESKDIEALYLGSFSSDVSEHQSHLGPLMVDWLGLCPIPSVRVEDACASAGVALQIGVLAVASGMFDVVMVGGVEKMSTLKTEEVTDTLALAVDAEYEFPAGVTFPGLYAEIATAYFARYGSTWEQLAAVSIKNHHNGSLNPKAQFQAEISDIAKKIGAKRGVTFKNAMDFLRSQSNFMVAYPLRLFDCCPISDGGAAAILTSADIAKKFTDTPMYLAGIGQASDSMALHDRADLTSLRAAVVAGRRAYKMSGLKSDDIDFAEVHDCFTIAELVATEDLGFFERGEGGKAVEEGRTALDGDKPINPDGGLKAKGHPVGATGVGMLYEIWKQLRGEAEKRQVRGAEVGLMHNVGASGGTCVVAIFRR